jgi:hypothetical protein
MVIIEEIGNYPKDDTIIYKQKNEKGIVSRSFTYKIITIEKYSDKKILQVTHTSNCYPISDDYKIQTNWRRGKENKVVQCIITYQENKSLFYIQYGENFNEQVFFKLSVTNAADLLHKIS